jgi:hypothetical protein
MRLPRIVSHVVDNESKTETLGFVIFYLGFYAALKLSYGAEFFLWCVVFSSVLVGGKLVTKSILEAMQMRLTGGKPTAPKEPGAPA